jgi:hypothetical protein
MLQVQCKNVKVALHKVHIDSIYYKEISNAAKMNISLQHEKLPAIAQYNFIK